MNTTSNSTSRISRSLAPFATRLAEGRPVLAQAQALALAKRIMDMTTAPTVEVRITHIARVITRIANNQVLSGDDGDAFTIRLRTSFDGPDGSATRIQTNQLDDSVLRAMVQQCEAVDRAIIRPSENVMPIRPQVPDVLVPVHLWHQETIDAMRTTRATVIPDLVQPIVQQGLQATGFLGFLARSEVYLTKEGISVFYEETDSELTVTARSLDGQKSGWGGQAGRNWTTITPPTVAAQAIAMAMQGGDPVAVEPGRRTAILGPAAVAQLMQAMAPQFRDTPESGFFGNRRVRWGQRYFDPRLTMRSDPADPDGGYCPYFEHGYGTPAMTWIDRGVLKNLAYDVDSAMGKGKAYATIPYSIRVSGDPTSTTALDDMIASCREGIYVNRFAGVEVTDPCVGLMTGVTRDGCFLVKDGKIHKAVKNFRFVDSPFFFFNNVEAIGPSTRAALGFIRPPLYRDADFSWPLPPVIVPPMMVRDFNFSALSDAV